MNVNISNEHNTYSAASAKSVRCAIYTRIHSSKSVKNSPVKDWPISTEDQRKTCEQYIELRKSQGWCALPKRYGDIGSTNKKNRRPGLKRLLADVKAGLIDVVVVRSLSRLFRCISDSLRLHNTLQEHGVEVVSVTEMVNPAIVTHLHECFVNYLSNLNESRDRSDAQYRAKTELPS